MSTIKVLVHEQSLRVIEGPKIASRGVNENYIKFMFDSSWTGFGKVAIFYMEEDEDNVYQSAIDNNDKAIIPWEVTALDGKLCFGVAGTKDNIIYTSEIVKYNIVRGVPVSGSESEPPSPTIYQQMLLLVGQVQQEFRTAQNNIDMLVSQMDEFISDHAGVYGETLIYDASVTGVYLFGDGQDVEPLNDINIRQNVFDFLDIYYIFNGSGYVFTKDYRNYNTEHVYVHAMSTNAVATNITFAQMELVLSGKHIRVVTATRTNWTASTGPTIINVDDDYVAQDPSDYPAGYVKKIIGRKLVGDAELVDARVGVDGTVYQTVGEAIRSQIDDVVGGAVELDTTLTQQGKAAEAKAVGDKIGEIKADLQQEQAKIGDLSDLRTEDKADLVSAINEAATKGASAQQQLDILYLYGDEEELNTNWANRDKAKMKFRYVFVHVDDKEQKNGWCILKLQGQTSIVNPKHNFNIQFFKDPTYKNKDKTNYYDFGKHPKFTIKANYIDYSQARNIVSARLWGDVVHSRLDMRDELSDAPNHGAVDGRPIILYMNDRYYGLYTFNIPKEDWMLGLDEDNPMTIAVGAENGGDACLFKSVSTSQWTVEVPDAWTSYTDGTTSETISSKTNFLAMMDFVVNSTDEEFVADIEEYFNLSSLIDYYIYTYCVANADTFNKNQLMCSWDCGKTWYFTAYDMDETFGIKLTGTASYDVDPLDTYDNRLFKRLETLFAGDIYDRYVELRSSIFSDAYMCREFELFFNLFPDGEKEKDKLLWTGVGNKNSSSLEFFEKFIHDRMGWCDSKFERMNPDFVACTGIALNVNTMTFDDVGATQTLVATLSPSNTTEALIWSSSNPNIATVSNNGVVTSVADGECIITAICGAYSATCSVTVDLVEAPIGYTLLPSLKVNNAYFDTGVKPNANTGFAIKYDASTLTESKAYGRPIIGNNNGTGGGYMFSTINHSGQTTWYSGGASKAIPNNSYANSVHKIELRNGLSVYIDDSYVIDINRGSTNPYPDNTAFAFAGRANLNNGRAYQPMWEGRTCYWLKIYDGTTLIRHYIPVSRDADSVLGFYDLVNDEFKQSASVSGTFSL